MVLGSHVGDPPRRPCTESKTPHNNNPPVEGVGGCYIVVSNTRLPSKNTSDLHLQKHIRHVLLHYLRRYLIAAFRRNLRHKLKLKELYEGAL
jgi:hypothetical protein